ncbi:MAG TPA: redoxin domain-containing protein [Methylomirabilota bacterium]|jgi:cytochrome oxidase Cu insertion factor (SCO1/SenC/PrrC family)
MIKSAAGSLVAVALWAAGAVAQPATAPEAWEKMRVQRYEPPKVAPAFALPALDGSPVRLEDQKGKALLLFFWATW